MPLFIDNWSVALFISLTVDLTSLLLLVWFLEFMQDPRESHWKVVKIIVCYLKGTSHLGIKYCRSSDSLVGFTDSDWAGDNDDQKSTSGYVFHFNTGPLVWSCKKQKVVSLSTTKVEYCGVVNAGTKAVWIHQLLGELGFPVQASTAIHCDNQSAIQVVDNLVAHSKMKHVKLHVHYLR
jgi:hypothetical protein